MKVYHKIMNVITVIEEIALALAMLLILVLTFGNVVARKVFQHSWGFTEEIVVAVFVLISLLGAGVAARDGELVNLSLIHDRLGKKGKKVMSVISCICCTAYSILLAYEGYLRIVNDHTYSPILHIAKSFFWSFVLIGGVSLALHFIENCLDECTGYRPEVVNEVEDAIEAASAGLEEEEEKLLEDSDNGTGDTENKKKDVKETENKKAGIKDIEDKNTGSKDADNKNAGNKNTGNKNNGSKDSQDKKNRKGGKRK